MDKTEEHSRRVVLKAYGVVSITQLFLGLFLFVAGLLALRLSDEFYLRKPPYYTPAFFVGLCIICAGICTLYIYLTEAPLIDYYFLEDTSVKRIQQSVRGNTISSILSLTGSLMGLFVCIAFVLGPCDQESWPFECSFRTNESLHKLLTIIITIVLAICVPLTIYSSLMSCIHGWVFDFDVIRIKSRKRTANSHSSDNRPVSGFQPIMFDVEDQLSGDDDLQTGNKYNATSSFKQVHGERQSGDEFDQYQHEYMRKHNVQQQQQAPNYVAVLNDPAMKQKLQERKSCLQEV